MRVVKWAVASLVFFFLLGATIAGSLVILAGGLDKATAVDLFQRFLQPLGTALVAGLYLWRDFLPDKKSTNSEARSKAKSEAMAQSAGSVVNINNVLPPAPSLAASKEDLKEAVDKIIKEKGDLSTGVVTAQRFILVDVQGRQRATLGIDPGLGPVFELTDDRGRRRLSLGIDKESEPELLMYDKDGIPKLGLVTAAAQGTTIGPIDAISAIIPIIPSVRTLN